MSKEDENNSEVKTIVQTDQVDNTDEDELDQDKFDQDDENKELGDYLKIKTDVKTILEMDQMEIDHVDTAEQDKTKGYYGLPRVTTGYHRGKNCMQ